MRGLQIVRKHKFFCQENDAKIYVPQVKGWNFAPPFFPAMFFTSFSHLYRSFPAPSEQAGLVSAKTRRKHTVQWGEGGFSITTRAMTHSAFSHEAKKHEHF